MRRSLLRSASFVLTLTFIINSGIAVSEESGESLFKKHCTLCHPDGGNIVNPGKTLSSKDLQSNGVKTADDIVRIMRNPNPGMLTFDEKKISDADAKKIADYILKTFK